MAAKRTKRPKRPAAKKREDAKSGSRKASNNAGHANLIPPKPGEVRNPEGRNQYTYRREFERQFQQAMTGEFPEELRQLLPSHIQKTIPKGAPASVALLWVMLSRATLDSSDKVIIDLMKRLLPAEARGTEDDPIHMDHAGSPLAGISEETLREVLKRGGGS